MVQTDPVSCKSSLNGPSGQTNLVNQPQKVDQSDSFFPTTELALKKNLFLKLAKYVKIKISNFQVSKQNVLR